MIYKEVLSGRFYCHEEHLFQISIHEILTRHRMVRDDYHGGTRAKVPKMNLVTMAIAYICIDKTFEAGKYMYAK